MSEDTMTDATLDQALTIEDIEAELAATLAPEQATYPGDPAATWDYWSGLWNPPDGPGDDLVWARLRHRRNQLLAACDFRVVADAPWDTAPWVAYRQALRDLTDTTKDPRLAAWPTPPED